MFLTPLCLGRVAAWVDERLLPEKRYFLNDLNRGSAGKQVDKAVEATGHAVPTRPRLTARMAAR
jgi:hypothetical protein